MNQSRTFLLVVFWCLCIGNASAQLSIRFSVDTIQMGDVFPCSTARDSFWLENTGTFNIPSPAGSNVSGFYVSTVSTDNIAPGERRRMYVDFTGTTANPFYRTPFVLTVRISGQTAADTLWLFARRLDGNCCVFRVDTVKGEAGDQAVIRIRQDSTSPMVNISGIQLAMKLGYNPTQVVPHLAGVDIDNWELGSVTFKRNLANQDSILFELPCTIVLGDKAVSSLGPVWFGVTDANLIHAVYDAESITTDVCYQSIPRLFDPMVPLPRVSVRSTVGGLLVEIEKGRSVPRKLQILDVRGLLIVEILVNGSDELAWHDVSLSNGIYIVVVDNRGFGTFAVLP